MIVELVTFRAPPGADRDAILADARATLPRWRANPDLVRKHYLAGEDGTLAGLYVWPSRAAAEAAHDADWRAGVEARTGSAPSIVYFDLMLLLDNAAGTVTEWGADGVARTAAPAAGQ